MSELTKVVLSEQDMPTHWYNINADLPTAGVEIPPPLHPVTHEVVGPDDLAPLFPMALIAQEVSTERYIEIPDEVQDIYHLWRPTPLFRAHRWEKALDTPAKIYYNYEGWSPSGSHKTNTAVAQAYYAKAGRRAAHYHRDWRRPVGQRAARLPARGSGLSARSGWCASATTRSPTVA